MHIARGRGSIGPLLTALRYTMYFRFCGCHHFSCHGASGSESSTTLWL